jgi:putative DNA primase/helicase
LVTPALITTSRIVWDAESVSITAAEAMVASQSRGDVAPALAEAKQFLATLVGTTGMKVKEIEKEAKDAGLSWATVRRAKDELKYKSERYGYGGPWVWKSR